MIRRVSGANAFADHQQMGIAPRLHQLMQGALESLAAMSVSLLGGHSNEGAELAFGLSVNGFAVDEDLLFKSGVRDGDCLVLTKALGSGVLLAANMAGAAAGRWVDGAIANMLLQPLPALAVLRARGLYNACAQPGKMLCVRRASQCCRFGSRLCRLVAVQVHGASRTFCWQLRGVPHDA